MNSIIKLHITRSTDCSRPALANLLHELTVVRDRLLVLPQWFTHSNTDLVHSVCVLLQV